MNWSASPSISRACTYHLGLVARCHQVEGWNVVSVGQKKCRDLRVIEKDRVQVDKLELERKCSAAPFRVPLDLKEKMNLMNDSHNHSQNPCMQSVLT